VRSTTLRQKRSNKVIRHVLQDVTRHFFGRLEKDPDGRRLLAEQDHRIEFGLIDGDPFYVAVKNGEVRVKPGSITPRRLDANDVIHFQLRTATLKKLLAGQIRFTDALIPTDPNGKDAMLLLECTLFKWSVLSWVGRMFRRSQTLQLLHGTRG